MSEYILRGHLSEISTLCFHPSELLLLSGSISGEVKLWDLYNRRVKYQFYPHNQSGIISLHFWNTNNTIKIITQGRDELINFWDAETLGKYTEPLLSIPAVQNINLDEKIDVLADIKKSLLSSINRSNDSKPPPFKPIQTIASGCCTFCNLSCIKLNNPFSSMPSPHKIHNNLKPVIEEEDDDLIAIDTDNLKKPVSLLSASLKKNNIKTQPKIINSPSPINYDSLIACPSENTSEVNIWDIRSGKVIQVCKAEVDDFKTGMSMCMKLIETKNGLSLVSGYESGHVALFSLRSSNNPISVQHFHEEPCLTLDVNQNLEGVCGSADKNLVMFHEENGLLAIKRKLLLQLPGISCLNIRSDHKIFATGGWDYRVRLWGAKGGKALAVFDIHTSTVSSVAFPPSSNPLLFKGVFASGSKDQKISIYNNIYSS